MNSTIKAIRAITGVYFQRLVTIGAVLAGVLLGGLWVLLIWLTSSVDRLWALLFVALIPITIIAFVIYGIFRGLSRELLPRPLNKQEKQVVTHLGDRVFNLTENAATPWFMHALMVSKDAIRGRESRHIRELITNTSSLRDDFVQVRRIFE